MGIEKHALFERFYHFDNIFTCSFPTTYVEGFHNNENVSKMVYNPLGNTGIDVSKISYGKNEEDYFKISTYHFIYNVLYLPILALSYYIQMSSLFLNEIAYVLYYDYLV